MSLQPIPRLPLGGALDNLLNKMLFPLRSFPVSPDYNLFVMQLSHQSENAFAPKWGRGECFDTNPSFGTVPSESETCSPRGITLNYGKLRQITPILIHDLPSLAYRCRMRVNATKSDQIRVNPSNFSLV